jgi:hypothetical protein
MRHRRSLNTGRGRLMGMLCLALWLAIALWLDLGLGAAERPNPEPLPPPIDGSIDWWVIALAAVPLIAYFVFLLKLSDLQSHRIVTEQLGEWR